MSEGLDWNGWDSEGLDQITLDYSKYINISTYIISYNYIYTVINI